MNLAHVDNTTNYKMHISQCLLAFIFAVCVTGTLYKPEQYVVAPDIIVLSQTTFKLNPKNPNYEAIIKKLQEQLTQQLTQAFGDFPGFKGIEVTNYTQQNGEVIATWNLKLDGNNRGSNSNSLSSHKNETILEDLVNGLLNNASNNFRNIFNIPELEVQEAFLPNLAQLITNSTFDPCSNVDACEPGYPNCEVVDWERRIIKCYLVPIEVKTFTVNGSKSIKANYGDSVVLHCEVTGSGGTYAVLSGPELSKFKNVSENTAVIDKTFANLTCQDAGRYFCWGQNGGGENGSREFVDVNITCRVEPPPVYQGKPYKPEKQITIESEKNTTFQFVVYGYPEPTSYDLRIQTIDNSYSNVTSNKYNVQYIHQEPPFGLVTLTIYDENTKETITYVLGINSEKGRVEVTVEVVKFTKKPAPDDTTTQMAIGIGVGVGGFLIVVVVIVVVCTVKYRRSRTPAGSRGMPMDQLYDKPGNVYNDRHYALAYENKIASDYDLPKN